MKKLSMCAIWLMAVVSAWAVDITKPIPEVKLRDGRVLRAVSLISYSSSSASARWDGGRGTIAYINMPDDLLAAIGDKRPKPPAEQLPAAPEPKRTEAPPEREGKVSLFNLGLQSTDSSGSYIYYSWKADIRNQTSEPYQSRARIGLYDSEGFLLEEDSADTPYIKAGQTATVTGKSMIKISLWDATKSYKVTLLD